MNYMHKQQITRKADITTLSRNLNIVSIICCLPESENEILTLIGPTCHTKY